MKKLILFLLLLLFNSISFNQTEEYIEDGPDTGDPNIYYLSPANGAKIYTNNSTQMVQISFAIDNLESTWWRGNFLGFEIWVLIDNVVRFYYRDNPPRHPPDQNYPNLSYSNNFYIELAQGSHNVKVFAKNFEVKFGLWLDTDTAERIHSFSILQQPPFTVYISGPATRNPGQTGTWTANPLHGTSPYQYRWWIYYPCDVLPLGSVSGDPQTDLPPCGSWNQIGATTKTITRYDYYDHILRCYVTDAQNRVRSADFAVDILGAGFNKEGEVKENTFMQEYSLKQNTPNPFNPTTKINYSIKEDGFVTLRVYDVLGKEVAELVNDYRSPGSYEVLFDASNLASGIYIYSLSTKNFNQNKKMILMR